MKKSKKLHRILEFLSTESERQGKSSFNSGEIAKAFDSELSIYEINTLCKILIDNEDVRDATTGDELREKMIAVLIIAATHDAYHTKKYLKRDWLKYLKTFGIIIAILAGIAAIITLLINIL